FFGSPTQAPASQTPFTSHGSSGVQVTPSLPGTSSHVCVASSQVITVHAEASIPQVLGVPVQTPAWQVSPTVQKRPSSQAPPSLAGTGSQASVSSLQTTVRQTSARSE